MKTTVTIQVSSSTHSKIKQIAHKQSTFFSAILARAIIRYFKELDSITKDISFFSSIPQRKGIEIDSKLLAIVKKKIKQLNLTRDYKQRVTMIGLFDILVDKYYQENIE